MDKLYVFQYLTDGAGNYLTNADGSFMINATQEYPLDMSTAGIASNRGDLRAVNSFSILANDAGDDWTLIINQYNLVGRFPSQATALGALAGCFIHADATADGLEFMISDMIQNGTGQIDEDGDNLMSQTFSAGEFIGTIRNFNKDTWAGTTNSVQQDLMVVGTATEPLLLADPLQTIRVPARYDTSYAFEVRTDKPFPNAILLASETIGPITANITVPSTLVVGQPATASATLTGYDTRIPVKYAWTWTQNPNGISTVVKQETTTSSTSSYTPTGVFNYRVEVELIYAFDDVSTGVSDSEITQLAAQPFEWLQGPEIQYLFQDNYGIIPVVDVDYIGTGAQFSFEWMKDGSPFGTDSASQLLVDPGVYTADVTGQNTWASDTITTRNSITIAASNDVRFVRLWTGLGPSGDDVTDNPPSNTLLYAYAYSDLAGTQLITSDVEFLDDQGVLASFSGTPTPSEVNAAEGTILSVTDIGVAGTDTPTVTYAWSTGATTPTLDTAGLEGTAITCTVTASNQWTPDATAFVDFGTITAQQNYPDWQSSPYAGQITGTTSAAGAVNVDQPQDSVYDPYWAVGPYVFGTLGWQNSSQLKLQGAGGSINTDTATAALPFGVYWNQALGQWFKVTSIARGIQKTEMIYDKDPSTPAFTYNAMASTPATLLLYATDPGDVSAWPAFVP